MITLLLYLLRLLPFLCDGRRQLALENLALRQQLAVYKRMARRPKLRRSDRHWTKLSRRPTRGRPRVDPEITALVIQMAAANPLWGAPRIHGEFLKLGIDVAERTVSRLMPKRRPRPSQTWRTFLDNHVRGLVSLDFFTVPTARLRVLFVLVVLAHHRRRVVHFNVTEHPIAHWTAQQIVDAFPAFLGLLREHRPSSTKWDEVLAKDRDAYTATHRIDADGITVSGAPTIGRACSIHDNGTVPHHPAKIHAPARPPRDRRVAHNDLPKKLLVRRCPRTPSRTSTKTAEGGDNVRRPVS